MTAPHANQIIGDYASSLEAALAPVAPERRRELVDEVRAHIAEARAELEDETDADLLNIIDRLGAPAETAAAEMESPEQPGPARTGPRPLDVAAIVLLVLLWPIGVVLVWFSQSWSPRDKLIGTLVPPGGFAGAAIVLPVLEDISIGPVCETVTNGSGVVSSLCSSGPAGAVIPIGTLVLAFVYVVGPLLTAVYLAVRLQRRRAAAGRRPPAGPALTVHA